MDRTWAFVAAAAVSSAASPAVAQVDDYVPVPPSAQVDTTSPGVSKAQGVTIPRTGAATARRLDVDAGVLLGYDTNVARGRTSLAQANAVDPEDFLYSPTISANILAPVGPANAYLRGSASYVGYGNNPRLEGLNVGVNGGVSQQIGPCTPSLDAAAYRARSNVIDLLEQGATERNFQNQLSLAITVACGDGVGLRPFVQAGINRGRNTNRQRRVSNSDNATFGGGVSALLPTVGEFGLLGSVEEVRYPDRVAVAPFRPATSFTTRSVGAYYTRALTPFFTAHVRVNYTDLDTPGGFDGLTGQALVRIAPTPRYSVEFAAYRVTFASLNISSDYGVEDRQTINLRYDLTARLGLSLGYSHLRRRYEQLDLLIDPDRLQLENLNVFSADSNFRLNNRLRLTLNVTHQQRNADNDVYDYDSTQVLGGLRLAL